MQLSIMIEKENICRISKSLEDIAIFSQKKDIMKKRGKYMCCLRRCLNYVI